MSLESRLLHPCFPQPTNTEIKLWRYMDLSKFVWLIADKKLHFARLDQLQDGFEGSTTRKTLDGMRTFLEGIGEPKGWENLRNIYRESREKMYVNCWYIGDAESEAMWKLYCPSGNGVAIKTTYRKLTQAIAKDEDIYIGCVTYADYDTLHFADSNLFYPVMHKRIAFSHENEARMVRRLDMTDEQEQLVSLTLDWNPQKYVESVFVDPYASEYHFQAVSAALKALAPDWEVDVKWSQMKCTPVFE